MPKQLHASVAIDLPGDEFQAADAMVKFKPAWDQFVAQVPGATVKVDVIETRAKPATNGARRGRKPRETASPQAPAPEQPLDLGVVS